MTFDELTKALGVDSHAPLPDGYYPVPSNRNAELCSLAMIDDLQKKYNLFGDYYTAVREGYSEIEKDPLRKSYLDAISLYFKDASLAEACTIKYPPSHNTPASNMLPLLVHLPSIENTYEIFRQKGLPHEEIVACLSFMRIYLMEEERYRSKFIGISRMISNWMARFTKGTILYLGKAGLNFQPNTLPDHFPYILKNKKSGKLVPVFGNHFAVHKSGIPLGSAGAEDEEGAFIATFQETETAFIGHPSNARSISKEAVEYPKTEWELYLAPGDDEISIHIFWESDFTPDKVDAALKEAVEKCKKYYPEYNFKALYCSSWLLSPDINDLLGEHAKLSQFSSRFVRFPIRTAATAALSYVFPNGHTDLEALEEKTSLQRGFKQLLLSGKHIYDTRGIIPLEQYNKD